MQQEKDRDVTIGLTRLKDWRPQTLTLVSRACKTPLMNRFDAYFARFVIIVIGRQTRNRVAVTQSKEIFNYNFKYNSW